MLRYGFVGLGSLGAHLAMSLVKAGFPVAVSDLDRSRAAALEAAGATWAQSPAEAAAGADAVITCLPSPKASEAVVTGPNGVLESLSAGGTWIEMSTVDPDIIERLAAMALERGIETLAVPVTGGVHRAESGQITILIGGEETVFARHRPAFEAMGGEIIHIGDRGQTALIKVITNMLAFIHLVALGEAYMLAKRGGIDLAKAYAAIKHSSGNSFVHETEGQLILNGSYDVAFTNALAMKDLGFAMEFGRDLGVPLDVAATVAQTFVRATARYGSEAQSTQVVKLLEDALGTDLRAPGFPARLSE